MESIYRAVRPIPTLAGYVGGKRNLAKHIVPIIDAHQHTCYAEPFVGMGGIFFRRARRPKCEVINDISRNVATLFRVLQRHYVAFLEMMRFQLATRAEFDRLMASAVGLRRANRYDAQMPDLTQFVRLYQSELPRHTKHLPGGKIIGGHHGAIRAVRRKWEAEIGEWDFVRFWEAKRELEMHDGDSSLGRK